MAAPGAAGKARAQTPCIEDRDWTSRTDNGFLEFKIPSHWAVFDATVRDIGGEHPLNVFLSRDAIQAWVEHLDLQIEAIHDGNTEFMGVPFRSREKQGRLSAAGRHSGSRSRC